MADMVSDNPLNDNNVQDNMDTKRASMVDTLLFEAVIHYLGISNLYPTPFIVLIMEGSIFSLTFLMCTSIVRSPT